MKTMTIKTMTKLAAVAIVASTMFGCSPKQKLYVYTWVDYIDPTLIDKFETENDCKIVIDTFDSNESMFAKLMAGASGYDIITPTEYVISWLIKAELIDRIDISKLPNTAKNFDPMFKSEWSLVWDVPYAFSCTGILWRKDKVPLGLEFNDWNDLFDSRLNGRICMMDDIREVLGIALKMNGHSVNSTSQDELDKAVEVAKAWKHKAKKMDNETYRTGIMSKELYAAMSYNSDAIMILAEDQENIGYSIPTNGTTSSMDVFCVMKKSAKKDLAYKFIDMFYDVSNAVMNAEYNGTPMPIAGIYEALSDKYKAIPFMRVTDGMKAKCEDIKDLGDKLEMYTKAWDKVKASK